MYCSITTSHVVHSSIFKHNREAFLNRTLEIHTNIRTSKIGAAQNLLKLSRELKELWFFGPLREVGDGEHSPELEASALATEARVRQFIDDCMTLTDGKARIEFVKGEVRSVEEEDISGKAGGKVAGTDMIDKAKGGETSYSGYRSTAGIRGEVGLGGLSIKDGSGKAAAAAA
jgi:hypothetical protein